MTAAADTQPDAANAANFKRELIATLPHLRAFARSLCGRADLADDLVQETAMRAWSARDRYVPGTNLRAWTFTILRNYYLDQWRREKRNVEFNPEAAEKYLIMPAPQEDPLHLSDMEAALQKMAPERREALLLIGAAGFSYEEAAQISQCAVGTMKSRVARARTELAARLNPDRDKDI